MVATYASGSSRDDRLGDARARTPAPRPRSRPGRERHHDVEPLAAGGLHEALSPSALEPLAHEPGRLDHARPRDVRGRIEVEHHAVRLLEVVDDGVPGVDLEDADLHEPDEARQTSTTRYSPTFVFSWIFTRRSAAGAQCRRASGRSTACTPSGQRTSVMGRSARCGQDPVGDRLVVAREVELGHALAGIEDALGVGQPHAGHRRHGIGPPRPFGRAGGSPRAGCAPAARPLRARTSRRRLVLAQALERRMSQLAVGVHSVNATSATSSGFTQCARAAPGAACANGRRRPARAAQPLRRSRRLCVGEAGADLAGVDEPSPSS